MVHKKRLVPVQESDGEDFSDGSASSEASVDDLVDDGWVFPIVQPQAKRSEYEAVCKINHINIDSELTTYNKLSIQALKEAQLKVSDLQITIRKLHMENADLAMRLKELKGEGTASSSGKKTKPSESDSHISQFAKFFGVMQDPFVPPSALLVTRPDIRSTHPGRYDSDLSKVQGITAELYEVLPQDMHSDLGSSPKFRSTV